MVLNDVIVLNIDLVGGFQEQRLLIDKTCHSALINTQDCGSLFIPNCYTVLLLEK